MSPIFEDTKQMYKYHRAPIFNELSHCLAGMIKFHKSWIWSWFGFLFVIAGTFLLASCAPIYMPTSPNTPMLTEKGDVKLELNSSTSGLEIKGSFALTDNYVVTGLISAGSGDADDDTVDNSIHRYMEAGFGHSYRPAHYLVIETIAGSGLGYGKGEGRITIGESTSTFMAEGTYIKPFLQNNIALQTDAIDFGFVNRLSVIQFGSIKRVWGDEEMNNSPSTPLFWEPTLFFQFGWDRIKLAIQYGYSMPIAGEPEFEWMPLHFGFGINYRFGN